MGESVKLMHAAPNSGPEATALRFPSQEVPMKRIRLSSLLLALALVLAMAPGIAGAATAGSSAGKVKITSGVLNVRASASTSAKIVTTLKKDAMVTLISKSGNWWKVEYAEGKYGYAYASYITQVSGSYAVQATGYLNVRTGAGTDNAVIGWLDPNEYVVSLSVSNGWHKILFEGGRIGYASGKYLATGSAGTGSGANSGYEAVHLAVPSFKQTDSRWANRPIGTSGGTIGTIGCPTTALAMTESFRTGSTITPDQMADRLTYTPGGAVYWPDHYAAYFNSDYLKKAHDLLKSGKPVLLGAKNASGSQHWVVITGFNGGALTAANFTMNDPGSSTRTTVQQFLNAYPAFYKLMHY